MDRKHNLLDLVFNTELKTLVTRFGYDPDMKEQDIMNALKNAVHEYLSTQTGYNFLKRNGWVFCWEDAIEQIPNTIWRNYRLHLFSPNTPHQVISVNPCHNLAEDKMIEAPYISAESYYGIFSQKDFERVTCPICDGKINYAFGTARCDHDDWMATDDELPELLGLDENFKWYYHLGQKVLLKNADDKYLKVVTRFVEESGLQYYSLERIFDSEILPRVSMNDMIPIL